MGNAELIALLHEARNSVLRDSRYARAFGDNPEIGRHLPILLDLLSRIDAALAAHEAEERVDSATPVVEWWSQSQQEASMGETFLRVWCAGPHAWRWTAWGPTTLHKSGIATNEAEAKSAAIAAARGMR